MSQHTDLVPCSNCGAPVLTNLAECMFCEQKDPGKVGANALGLRWLKLKYSVLKQQRELTDSIRLPSWMQPLDEIGATTNFLIAICVGLYLVALLADAVSTGDLISNGFLAPSNQILARMGTAGRWGVSNGRAWGVITAIYLHGGVLHLLGNMVVLWRFGNSVDNLFGRNQYFLIFTFSGLAGSLLTTMRGTQFAVGASGAIFGLLGALIVYWAQDGSPYAKKMMQQIAIYTLVIFIFGASTSNVDNTGHLGGFIGGVGIAYVLRTQLYRTPETLFARAAQACVGLTIVAFTLSLVIPLP